MFSLRRIVSAYLYLAESFFARHIPMTMSDWEERLNKFLELSDYDILENVGKNSTNLVNRSYL